MIIKQDIINLLYPGQSPRAKSWGGWIRFFNPALPSRLFPRGFRVIDDALDDPSKVPAAVKFLSSTHIKQSRSGDELCKPTPLADKLVAMLNEYQRGSANVVVLGPQTIRERLDSMIDPTCHPDSNLQHVRYAFEGYQCRVTGSPERCMYAPGSAKESSWRLGWSLADADMT